MTGRIAGGAPPKRDANDLNKVYRGSNQVGLRALNERLVLSLIRIHGQLSKVQIAEITGLAAQTASVIVRALEADGLLMAGAPIRGKVGQPSVPMSINPNGVLFLGLRLGPRDAQLALVNFAGRVLAERNQIYEDPNPETISSFFSAAFDSIKAEMNVAQRARLHGLGIAAFPELFQEMRTTLPGSESSIDSVAVQIATISGLPVLLQNEAMAVCSGELAYGLGAGVSDFLYFYLAEEIDGAIIHQGRILQSGLGSRPGIGELIVPDPEGKWCSLADLVISSDWSALSSREADDIEVRRHLGELAHGLSHIAHVAASLWPLTTIIIDGSMPQVTRRKIVQAVSARLVGSYREGRDRLVIREGTMGRNGATLGAACLPLIDGFFLNANSLAGGR